MKRPISIGLICLDWQLCVGCLLKGWVAEESKFFACLLNYLVFIPFCNHDCWQTLLVGLLRLCNLTMSYYYRTTFLTRYSVFSHQQNSTVMYVQLFGGCLERLCWKWKCWNMKLLENKIWVFFVKLHRFSLLPNSAKSAKFFVATNFLCPKYL